MSDVDFLAVLADIKEKTENSTKTELESLRTQLKAASKTTSSIHEQLARLEMESASNKGQISSIDTRLNLLDSFSSRLTKLENKLAQLESALEQK